MRNCSRIRRCAAATPSRSRVESTSICASPAEVPCDPQPHPLPFLLGRSSGSEARVHRGRNGGLPLALAAALAFVPAGAAAQRIGMYFDAAAETCSASIAPFGPDVHIWIYAFPPAGVPIGG